MKYLFLLNLILLPLTSSATEPLKGGEAAKAQEVAGSTVEPVLANTEGKVQVLVPSTAAVDEQKKAAQKTINGKVFEVIEGVPGMKIPNGAILQTLGDAKAQVILENGNSFVAGKATEMVMSWAKDVKGKTALDINVKDGLVRGIVSAKEDFNVNLVTASFKAQMKNAEFISGAIESGNVADAAKGAMLKMIHGESKLKQLTKLSNLNAKDAKEMVAQAGSDLVMGIKDMKNVPFLQNDILQQATSIKSTMESLKNASAKDWLSKLVAGADNIANEVGKQPGPPPDTCGCPTLEERIRRAALKKARGQLAASTKKPEGEATNLKTDATAGTDTAKANAGELSQAKPSGENSASDGKKINSDGAVSSNEAKTNPEGVVASNGAEAEKGFMEGLDPLTELSCMSPVLSQLKGAAQIVKSLKDGIFSSKEAKPGDCVSNNSLFKNLTDSRSALKFPNGDEIFSSDKTDVVMKWTKKKLDLKVDQGTIRGVFKQSPDRLVNLKANGINATTSGGDMQVSSKSPASSLGSSLGSSLSSLGSVPNPAGAQLAAAAALAPAATGLASGLLGSAISVFGGLASVAGQTLSAGTQLAAGQSTPRKLSLEEINELQSQTTPPNPQATSLASAAAAGAAGSNLPAAAAAAATSGSTSDTAATAAGALAAAGAMANPGAASAVGAAAAGVVGAVGSAVSTGAGAVGSALTGGASAVANPAASLPKLPGSSEASEKIKDAIQKSSPTKPELWKTGGDEPEEDFIKKYLNY